MMQEWEWAVRYPGSDLNHIQPDEPSARSLIAMYPDHDLTLLRRPVSVYRSWEVVTLNER